MVLFKKGVLYFLVCASILYVKENNAYSFCKALELENSCVLLATEFQEIPTNNYFLHLDKKIDINIENPSHGSVAHLIATSTSKSSCTQACDDISKHSTLPQAPSQFAEAVKNFVNIERTPKKKELLHRLMAVHATNFFPQDGIIRVARKTTTGGFRPKIHFNLGGVVQGHKGGNWDESGLAILVPLHSIADQLVNIFPDDTTILGDFELPLGAIIVANQEKYTRHDFSNPTFRRMNIVYFNPKSKTLRQKVSEVLDSRNSLRIWTKEGGLKPEAKNLRYFESFLRAYPHVTFGPERSTFYGQNGLYGQLDWNIISLLSAPMYGFARLKTNQEMTFLFNLIERDLQSLEEKVRATYSNPNALEGFEVAKKDLHSKLLTARKELQIRQRGKSIFLSKKELFSTVLDLRDQPVEQDRFIEQNFDRFQVYDPEEDGLTFDIELAKSRIFWKLMNFEEDSILEIFRSFPFLQMANFKEFLDPWVVVSDGENQLPRFLIRSRLLSRKQNGSSFDWCITQAGLEQLLRDYPEFREWKEGECFSQVRLEFTLRKATDKQDNMEYGL